MTTESDVSRGGPKNPAPAGAKDQSQTTSKKADPVVDVAAARAELAATLDALQDKFNVPKRIRIAAEENPIALGGVAIAVAAAIAGAAWLVVRTLRSR